MVLMGKGIELAAAPFLRSGITLQAGGFVGRVRKHFTALEKAGGTGTGRPL